MQALSAFVTTFNNESTLDECLSSVAWADEIVVLDSFSTDATVEIARKHGCHVFQQEFRGYGPQKQDALERTTHRWVLLLDADEALTPQAQTSIQSLLKTSPTANGYSLPRVEQMFWQFAHRGSRLNYFLRLFDKTHGHISDMPIHAAPVVDGLVEKLDAPFIHYGEPDIHTKVAKVNAYSSGLVEDKQAKGRRASPWVMVWYPPIFFLRIYLFKRNFMNGWAGFIASVISAFYAFMKYAKLYEAQRHKEAAEKKEHE
jgi:glycosyltransferase involved in cell wall biosynthesis